MCDHRGMQIRAFVAAALLGVALGAVPATASAAGKSLTEATDADKAAAGKAYVEAKAHYDATPKRLDQALAGFRASYDIVASPNSHLMVATVLADMGKHAEAYAEAEIVAAEGDALGGTYLDAAKAARNIMDTLRPKVAFVTVDIAADASPTGLKVAGRDIDRASWGKPVVVEPGSVEVVLSTATGPSSERVDVAAGATSSVHLAAKPTTPVVPEPIEDDNSGPRGNETLRIAGYAAGGVGVASLLVFAGLGAANNGKFNDLEDACPGGVCPPDRDSDISSGKSLQAGANAMAAIGVIGLAAGAALVTAGFLVQGSTEEGAADPASPEGARRRAPAASFEVGFGLGTVGLRARY